ncbi:MAG TPA: hypothetical protein VNR86_00900 [Sphingomicrobium sp.]|nr:hypothetical protein [Sphingomicrobium sp.]
METFFEFHETGFTPSMKPNRSSQGYRPAHRRKLFDQRHNRSAPGFDHQQLLIARPTAVLHVRDAESTNDDNLAAVSLRAGRHGN